MRLCPDESDYTQVGYGALWGIWAGGDFTGDKRGSRRVTVLKTNIHRYTTEKGRWGTLLFNQVRDEMELPNVRSVKWTRSVDQDAATCTVELWNTRPLGIGEEPSEDDYEGAGWYTFNRGTQGPYNRWGYATNSWKDVLVENRVIFTYEGYGFDPLVEPRNDTNMMQTGAWLIDKVKLRSDKTIVLTCRDASKILIEEICFPPVVPLSQYPISFTTYHKVKDPVKSTSTASVTRLKFDDSSNTPYVGRTGKVYGHKGADAFDSAESSYWLSIGNDVPNADYSYEWVQGKMPACDVTHVTVHPWHGNYVVYISLMVNGVWLGSSTIPYNPDAGPAAPNGANIKYVKKTTIGWEQDQTIKLGRTYKNVQKVRVTFTKLSDSNLGPYQYRAGVRFMDVNVTTQAQAKQTYHTEGNIADYTDIVEYFCALGGFFWPGGGSTTFHGKAEGTAIALPTTGSSTYAQEDTAASSSVVGYPNRVWGHFEKSGTGPKVPLPASQFDKKPLMDGIQYVKDILGFIFYVDEDGRAIFRSPNVWSVGNFVYPRVEPTPQRGIFPVRTDYIPEIDEQVQLKDIEVTLDDTNGRSQVFVANTDGRKAGGATGREAHPMGLERVAIYTDQNFESSRECQVMADLIALRYVFSYRTDSLTIPGVPMLQCDDQVRVWDRTTGEVYIHYVRSISSSNDTQSGWSMGVDTHWLGDKPEDIWAFSSAQFSIATKDFLKALGKAIT